MDSHPSVGLFEDDEAEIVSVQVRVDFSHARMMPEVLRLMSASKSDVVLTSVFATATVSGATARSWSRATERRKMAESLMILMVR